MPSEVVVPHTSSRTEALFGLSAALLFCILIKCDRSLAQSDPPEVYFEVTPRAFIDCSLGTCADASDPPTSVLLAGTSIASTPYRTMTGNTTVGLDVSAENGVLTTRHFTVNGWYRNNCFMWAQTASNAIVSVYVLGRQSTPYWIQTTVGGEVAAVTNACGSNGAGFRASGSGIADVNVPNGRPLTTLPVSGSQEVTGLSGATERIINGHSYRIARTITLSGTTLNAASAGGVPVRDHYAELNIAVTLRAGIRHCEAAFEDRPFTPFRETGSGLTRDVAGFFSTRATITPMASGCGCCQYRQFVEYDTRQSPAWFVDPTPTFVAGFCGESLPDSPSFHEDASGCQSPNRVNRYGHRSDTPAGLADSYRNASGDTDQANGCNYVGGDTPGISGGFVGTGYYDRTTFIQRVYDCCGSQDCMQGRVVAERRWSYCFEGVFGLRDPTPCSVPNPPAPVTIPPLPIGPYGSSFLLGRGFRTLYVVARIDRPAGSPPLMPNDVVVAVGNLDLVVPPIVRALGDTQSDQVTMLFYEPLAGDATRELLVHIRGASSVVPLPSEVGSLPRPCIADVDDGSGMGIGDGGVTIEDLLFFLDAYAGGSIRADVDDGNGFGAADGGVTVDDLLFYLDSYSRGC